MKWFSTTSRFLASATIVLLAGCNVGSSPFPAGQTLVQAKQGFKTKIVRSGDRAQAPERARSPFKSIMYDAPPGKLAAYITEDPGDGTRHPAIVWITGGDNNSIGDVWSRPERSNDQGASPFRKQQIVMMFPSQRGGNNNPGKREGFLGEVDDVLAATDYLASLPYVDPEQIYLGGHSTGGTLVMLVAASTDRYKAVFSLGPVALASHYGGDMVYCSPRDSKEMALRSPIHWLHCIQSPTYVFEGAPNGNWQSIQLMVSKNKNSKVKFFKVNGHDHFSVIGPLCDVLAKQVADNNIQIDSSTVQGLR